MAEQAKSPIGIFGAGYVGLVTGACFAELGHSVVVRDVVPERIAELQGGHVPIHEPGLAELVERNRERLRFTLEIADVAEEAELLFVCVQTPPTYSGDADLSFVWTVLDELAGLDRPAILVMKSTVPVGTGEKVRAALDARGLAHLGYVSNPEFLAEGTAVRDFMHPDRIVIGALEETDGHRLQALYESFDAPIVRTDVASAEMVKLASNAALMARISFINEIANVCEAVGADVVKVAEGIGLDHRLGPHFLRAGIGYGGSCLVGEETVLVRQEGRVRLVSLERLFGELAPDEPEGTAAVVRPTGLEVLSWRPGAETPEFLPVEAATRRPYEGEILQVRTKMGRRVQCTPDHPFVVADGRGEAMRVKLAEELTEEDWLPIAQGAAPSEGTPARLDVLEGLAKADLAPTDVIVRPAREELAALVLGADQVERTLDLVRSDDAEEIRLSLSRQAKRIAPTGYRRHSRNAAWVRVQDVRRAQFAGSVYSLEILESNTFVTTGGLVVHNCFPKDASALKQLAANSGYHFQLLAAVIEVNELQRRRVVGKLQKHLDSLRGKRIAVLGLAFKPNTDDMREAPSLVVASRLLAEGADVRTWDPVADARELLHGATQCETALEALRDADAAVIVTEWPQLKELDWAEVRDAMRRPLVIDGRNFLDPAATVGLGFTYEGVGRAADFAALPEAAEPAPEEAPR